MSISAKELAKILNLSQSAISLALNDKPGVSTNTKKLVLEAAKKYDYDFAKYEKKKANNMNGTICLLFFKKSGAVVTDTQFFNDLSKSTETVCKENNYYFNISYIYTQNDITKTLNNLKSSGVKGLILLGTEANINDITPFTQCDIPFVLLDTCFDLLNVNSVSINNVQGAYIASNYLIHSYKAQPGYLHSSYEIKNFQERTNGFYKAIRDNGMATGRSEVIKLAPSIEGAYYDMLDYLNEFTPSRCYFADNDLIAIGAINALHEKGFKVPEDVAIVGFDNIELTRILEPNITTINVDKYALGEVAIKLLIDCINSNLCQPLKVEINTKLIKRKSA